MQLRADSEGQLVWEIRSSTAWNVTELGPNLELWVVNDPVLNCNDCSGFNYISFRSRRNWHVG